MFVLPRSVIRNSLLIVVTIVVLFCIKDTLFELLTGISSLASEGSHRHDATEKPASGRNVTKRELMLVQMLFRHGHRAPFMLYPYDPNSELDWKEGMGMLTQLGRLQHYAMGVHLQNRYKDFITTNPKRRYIKKKKGASANCSSWVIDKEKDNITFRTLLYFAIGEKIEMINSNNFRCQYGVYCFIAGLYEPTKEFSFTDELRWQPIISRQADFKGKSVLTRGKCKISDDESYALKRSIEANATRAKYHDLYNFWSKNSGRLIDSWVLASDLGKTISCEKEYNLTIPDWTQKYWDEFSMQTGIAYYFNYGTKLIQRYRIGPLIGYMIERMNDRILGQTEKKFYIFSAHGSNIACLLLALDQYNWKGPPYASTVVLELWKEDDEDYSIRWLFFNSTNPEKRVDPPYPLVLEGCGGEFCPFGKFQDIVRRLIPDNWKKECNDSANRLRFMPFESTTHIPGLAPYMNSSARSSIHIMHVQYIVMTFLLICIHLYSYYK
ncbi:lysosomal acid phosphatase [Caerostris extrusa]|uniref:acid phosphatase n=1 Tax=Caerostris extrusa TaxID=172846 RepID=A0AAV4UAH2_CAEEX|nr:lysosomal acid phosphatase [Caerostris extrusa]